MDDAARRGDGRKARNGVAGKFAGLGNGPGGAHGVAGSCGLRGAAVGLARSVNRLGAACGLADVRPERPLADAQAGRFIGGKPGADAVTLGAGFDVPREAGRMLRSSRQSAMAQAFLCGAPDKESPRASAMRSSAATVAKAARRRAGNECRGAMARSLRAWRGLFATRREAHGGEAGSAWRERGIAARDFLRDSKL